MHRQRRPMIIPVKKKSFFKRGEKLFIILSVIIILGSAVKASEKYINNFSKKDNDGCAENMVFIGSENGGFCIDKYEESVGHGCPNVVPSTQAETMQNINVSDCKSSSIINAVPWRFVSQNQAAVICAKSGKRLPTNKEWLLAAMGTPDKSSEWSSDDCHVSANWSKQPGLTGSGSKCQSPLGVYDMIGNVWEWVDGTIANGQYKGKSLPGEGYILAVDDEALPSKTGDSPDENNYSDYFWIKNKDTRGIARGGYWDNKSDAGQYAVYMVSEPSFAGDGVGFRCVK